MKWNQDKSGPGKDPKIQDDVNQVDCISFTGALKELVLGRLKVDFGFSPYTERTGFSWVKGEFRFDGGFVSLGLMALLWWRLLSEGHNKPPQFDDSDLFCGCYFGFVCEI